MRRFTGFIVMPGLVCSIFLIAGAAAAQDARWHAGASVAQEYDRRASTFGSGDAEYAQGLLAGVRLDGGWGLELDYVDLGKLDFGGALSGGFHSEGELWSLAATYGRRFDNIEPYARLGWFSAESDVRSTGLPSVPTRRESEDGIAAEIGLRWFVTDPLAVRLGWVWYDFEVRDQGRAQLAVEWHF
jgi:hypothetical protein